jgi:adenylyltransferase/sulfurtransferase
MVELSTQELERYDRQIRINGWSAEGQTRIKSARVVIAGVGGLGCPSALYLAAAGVGTLKLIDNGKVELSNLNRQILHNERDIGKFKVDSAKEKLFHVNHYVNVETSKETISDNNVDNLVKGCDIIVDGMDNLETRFVLNRSAVRNDIPFVHGSAEGMQGHMMTIMPRKSPCLCCLYGSVPLKPTNFPVAGPAPAAVASLQSMEVLKLITGIGKPATEKLIVIDGTYLEMREVIVKRNPQCTVCGDKRQKTRISQQRT